jgi:hypothetical protein
MHCITNFFRSPGRAAPAAPTFAGRRAAAQTDGRESVASLDGHTTWPTHRIRWYLSLKAEFERGGSR